MKNAGFTLVVLGALMLTGCGGGIRSLPTQKPAVAADFSPAPCAKRSPVAFSTQPAGGTDAAGPSWPSDACAERITADQVFSDSMVGQVWTFQNDYDDTTTISIEPLPADAWMPEGSVVWHYTKDDCRGYWAPGVCQAELWFVLTPQEDGSWASTASLIRFPHSCPWCTGGWTQMTMDILLAPGRPTPYVIVPAHAETSTRSLVTAYLGYQKLGTLTFDSVVSPPEPNPTDWRTDTYIEEVSTPAYSGPAMVSEQWEGGCAVGQPGCFAHEKWYFAPGMGLVKVIPLDLGGGTTDLRLTMERVR